MSAAGVVWAFACTENVTQGPVCEPFQKVCDDDRVMKCREDGAGFDEVKRCDQGSTCSLGACVPLSGEVTQADAEAPDTALATDACEETDAADDAPAVDEQAPPDSEPDPDATAPEPELVVELKVANATSADRIGEVVTQGVPLAASAGITDAAELSIVDEDGAALPHGLLVQSRWGGPAGEPTRPIQWLLVDVRVVVPAFETRTVRLVRNGPSAPATQLKATTSDEAITVDTGAAVFEVARGDFSMIRKVIVAGAEMGSAQPLMDVLVTLDGSASAQSLAGLTATSVKVVQASPLRVRVEARGPLTASTGTKLPLEHTTYLDFYEGSGRVRAFLRVTNPNAATHPGNIWLLGSPGSILVDDLSLRVYLQNAGTYEVAMQDGAWSAGTAYGVRLYQDSSGKKN